MNSKVQDANKKKEFIFTTELKDWKSSPILTKLMSVITYALFNIIFKQITYVYYKFHTLNNTHD